MLVSCPTCPAEYEVDADEIGPEGRVVECSNCGARWHQPSPPPAAGAGREPDAIPGLSAAKASLEAMNAPEEEEERSSAPRYESLYGDDEDDAPAPGAKVAKVAQLRTPPAKGRPRPEEEAPGLSDALRDPRKGRALPDAARLNAELRASADEEERLDRQAQGGFRTGLYLIVLVGLIAIGGYHGRGFIASKFPPAAPYLDRYAEMVDDLHDAALRAVSGLVQTAPTAPPPAEPAPTETAPADPAPAEPEAPAETAPADAAPTETAPGATPGADLPPEAAPQESGAIQSPDATRTATRPVIGGAGGGGGLSGPQLDDAGTAGLSLGGGGSSPSIPRSPGAPAAPSSPASPGGGGLPSLGAPEAPPAPSRN